MSIKERVGAISKQTLRFTACWLKRLCVLIGAVILISVILGLAVGGLAARYIFSNRENLPNIRSFVNFEVPQVGIIEDSKGRPIINLAKEYRLIIKPENITWPVRVAFLSAEDKDFYAHDGVDWNALFFRAAGKNIEHSVETSLRERELRIVVQQGASTIADQILGLYYRDHINSVSKTLAEKWWGFLPSRYLRKIEELRLAIWLEEKLIKPEYFGSKRKAKDEILARFLSYTYFRKVYGVKAASIYYLGKEVEFLDYGEAALLAGIVKNPGLYAPVAEPPNNLFTQRQLNRRNNVLDLMVENGYLNQNEADKFKERALPIPQDKRSATDAPSVVGDILSELKSTGINMERLFNGEVRIRSVINLDVQAIANNALEDGLETFEERYPESKGVIQGSVVVLRNSDAAILAEVGGRKVYNNRAIKYSDFNRVRHSLRQPGSAFKPFVYMTAFIKGWYLDDTIKDIPIAVPMGNGKPAHLIQNYDGKYKGDISMRKALAESRNAATMWLSGKLGGVGQVIEAARMLGIKTELQSYPTTAIGASEVRLLELANAYRAIASGILTNPYVIDRIIDNNGVVIFKKESTAIEGLFPLKYLELMQEALRGTVRIPGGTAYSLILENFPIQLMCKTGTTNDFRDALLICSTYGSNGITVAARIGYDDNRRLGNRETGARTAMPIVKEIFRKAYEQNIIGPPPEFPQHIEENINNYVLNPR